MPDEGAAYRLLEELRWPGGSVTCPHCAAVDAATLLRPRAATGRRTRTGAVTARRVWKCRRCRGQFSVLTGTVMHGTRLPVRTWLDVIADWSLTGRRPEPVAVAREHAADGEAARLLLRRLTLAFEYEPARSCQPAPRTVETEPRGR